MFVGWRIAVFSVDSGISPVGAANHGNTQIFNPAYKCVVDSAPVQRILFPRERDEGQQAEQAYRDVPCQRSGFSER